MLRCPCCVAGDADGAGDDDDDDLYIFPKITKKLVKQWEYAANGAMHPSIKSLQELMSICRALHLLTPAEEPWGVPTSKFNPMGYECHGCKMFKQVGICSCCIAINQLSHQLNLRRLLENNTDRPKAGRRHKPTPALQRQVPLPKAGQV